jgi:hypothetical protein
MTLVGPDPFGREPGLHTTGFDLPERRMIWVWRDGRRRAVTTVLADQSHTPPNGVQLYPRPNRGRRYNVIKSFHRGLRPRVSRIGLIVAPSDPTAKSVIELLPATAGALGITHTTRSSRRPAKRSKSFICA